MGLGGVWGAVGRVWGAVGQVRGPLGVQGAVGQVQGGLWGVQGAVGRGGGAVGRVCGSLTPVCPPLRFEFGAAIFVGWGGGCPGPAGGGHAGLLLPPAWGARSGLPPQQGRQPPAPQQPRVRLRGLRAGAPPEPPSPLWGPLPGLGASPPPHSGDLKHCGVPLHLGTGRPPKLALGPPKFQVTPSGGVGVGGSPQAPRE